MKDILELLKNLNKKIYIFALSIVIILNFGIWKALKLHKEAIIKSGNTLLESAGSFSFLIILFICVKALLKKSDRESTKNVNEHLYKPNNYETDGNIVNASYTKVYKQNGSNNIVGTIEIKINNISEDVIDLCKGQVYFYQEKTRVKKLDFEIVNLNAGNSEQIFYSVINDDTNNLLHWDFFELNILELKNSQNFITNKTLKSKTYYKTYYFILNIEKFVDYKIFGLRLKYNMAWIKLKLQTEVIPRVTFLYKRKNIYINKKPPFFKELFSLLQRFIAFTAIYSILILFVIFIFYAVYDICIFFIEFLRIWSPIVKAKI